MYNKVLLSLKVKVWSPETRVALVRISVRRIKLAMPSAFAYQAEYHAAYAALTASVAV